MAQNLRKEGPPALRSLSESDVLHLVDLLISEMKWMEEHPSQTSTFKLTRPVGKTSLVQARGSKVLSSIFLGTTLQSPEHGERKYQNIPRTGVSPPAVHKKPSVRSRSEIALPDSQENSASHSVANSDCELSDSTKKNDDFDPPWEELGPVADTSSTKNEMESVSRKKTIEQIERQKYPDYEPSISDDDKQREKVYRKLVRRQRAQKTFSFVAGPVEANKDKLIDGILGSLKKSDESRVQG
ncbi:hypothetical protein F2P56_022077 [Juglans regia]|uniref:OST-HTH associated domain-containing protein n=1 Tax=Juglans regia TaxID=51240 RepID=A0A833USF3_JUGRE|nr:hypothetical protein F2P56_022077 [Juglans regia]